MAKTNTTTVAEPELIQMGEDDFASKVYVLTDENGVITRVEGGYTMSNIQNIDEWTYIDSGYGDKYNLCQSNYFEDGLFTEDFLYRYKLVDGQPVHRTEEELQAERDAIAAIPAPVDPRDAVIAQLMREVAELKNA